MEGSGADRFEDEELTSEHWRWTILASMADYIDAGSIVAGAVGLAVWAQTYGMSESLVGLLAAISSNAISAGVGAIIGGRLGDLYGRKRIYQYDLLLYAFGTLWIVFVQNIWMLIIGYILVGLAVGADVPTSWTLISEFSPAEARGKLMSVTNIFWYIGPLVTLGLALPLVPFGLLGIRILWAHLTVAAIITWFFRRGMVESERWRASRDESATAANGGQTQTSVTAEDAGAFAMSELRDLFSGRNLKALVFITAVYGAWNLVAGTYGFFYPYILETLGSTSRAASYGLQALWFITAMIGVAVVFMRYGDRTNRRVLYGISALMQTVGFVLFLIFPVSNIAVAIANVVLFGFGHGIAAWPLYRVWSVELFPTKIRSTAQGVITGIMRIGLGFWSFAVPVLAATGFKTVALILALLLTFSLVTGLLFAPNTGGKSLETIQEERERSA